MIYYTSKQLAMMSGYSMRSIYEHVKQGYITPVPVGTIPGVKHPRFAESAVKKWMRLYSPEGKRGATNITVVQAA